MKATTHDNVRGYLLPKKRYDQFKEVVIGEEIFYFLPTARQMPEKMDMEKLNALILEVDDKKKIAEVLGVSLDRINNHFAKKYKTKRLDLIKQQLVSVQPT